MQIKQFAAHIAVDGSTLYQKEYGLRRDKDKDVETWSCYVASEVGKPFAVVCHDVDLERQSAVHGVLKLDGEQMGWGIITTDPDDEPCMELGTVAVGHDQEQPFIFTKVVTTESEECSLDASDIGSIELTLRMIRIKSLGQSSGLSDGLLQDEREVPERLKVSSHIIGFGEPRPCEPTVSIKCDYGELVARFRFKYRPIDVLVADRIAPPSDLPRKRAQMTPIRTSTLSSSSPTVKVEDIALSGFPSDQIQAPKSRSESVQDEIDDCQPDLELMVIPKEEDEDVDMDDEDAEPGEEPQLLSRLQSEMRRCTQTLLKIQRQIEDLRQLPKERKGRLSRRRRNQAMAKPVRTRQVPRPEVIDLT